MRDGPNHNHAGNPNSNYYAGARPYPAAASPRSSAARPYPAAATGSIKLCRIGYVGRG